MLEHRIKNIIANTIDIDPSTITAESKIEADLGADSLGTVEIILSLEDNFDIEFSDRESETIITVGDLFKLVDEKTRHLPNRRS